MAQKGLRAVGVDFAPEMIRKCDELRLRTGVDAEFTCASIFDYDAQQESYDLLSALGFIEYISQDQLGDLLYFSRRTLRANGLLALGSRNRLFNLFSLNDYTALEMELGTMNALLNEACAIANAPSLDAFFHDADAKMLPQPASHPRTGIGVNVRYQYTPAELATAFRGAGFEPIALYPVHYHPMAPGVAAESPAAHVSFANWAFEQADYRMVPPSSSFVIGARKV